MASRFKIYTETDPRRASVEAYIHRQFSRCYGANIKQFMPCLLTLEKHGQILAAIGFRLAANHSLFLEQYLTKPVEQLVSEIISIPVKRDFIVEIGNLASSHPGRTRRLFVLLTFLLKSIGCEWVVCNTTPKIRNTFKHMGFEFLTLQKTSSALLQHDAHLWGSYYSHDPRLCLGSLTAATQKLWTMNDLSLGAAPQQARFLSENLNHKGVAA